MHLEQSKALAMSITPFIIANQDIVFSSGLYVIILTKRILKYRGFQVVNVTLTGDYETDRNLIFGKGSAIKNKPLVKAVMMICGYHQAKAYVTPDEEFEDKIVSIYSVEKPRIYGRYFFIEVLSALLARVTNYFQAIQGVRDEDPEYIKQDIDMIIDELIYRLAYPSYKVYFKVNLYEDPPMYEVEVEIFRQ